MLRFIIGAFVASALGACDARPVLQPATKSFGEGAENTATIVNDQVADYVFLARQRYASAHIMNPSATAAESHQRFGEFTCQGLYAFQDERAAISAVQALSKTMDGLIADPSDDLKKLYQSLRKYGDENPIPVPTVTDFDSEKAFGECVKFVREEVEAALESGEVRPYFVPAAIAAAPTIIESAKALAESLEKLTILVMQRADMAQREALLREMLLGSEKGDRVRDLMVKVFGKCAEDSSQDREKLEKCLKQDDQALFSDVTLDDVSKYKKVSALLLPYFQFNAFLESPKASTLDRAKAMEAATAVNTNLSMFDKLYQSPTPKGIAQGMMLSYWNLVRLARKDYHSEEELQILLFNLELYATATKEVVALGKKINEDTGKLTDSFKDLPF